MEEGSWFLLLAEKITWREKQWEEKMLLMERRVPRDVGRAKHAG